MSDYQIRKWKGWHHHHTLVFMAGLYLLKQRIDAKAEFPLMSTRDARILMIVSLFGTKKDTGKYKLTLTGTTTKLNFVK